MTTVDWMGRYRRLIETLVRHRNAFARVMNTKTEFQEQLSLSILEWEVLEYIIEHEADDSSMSRLSERLIIPPSSFSKITRTLCDLDLIAKYRMVGNNKNIILKPTEEGKLFYTAHSEKLQNTIFGEFFDALADFSDEELDRIARAVAALTPSTDAEKNGDRAKEYRLVRQE